MRARDVVQWFNVCLTCMRPWFNLQYHKKKKKFKEEICKNLNELKEYPNK
jgi:hypothetical protein